MTSSLSGPKNLIIALDSEYASLPLVGGKGASLVRLYRVGFPVPEGFIITTQAYQAFVSTNSIQGEISSLLPANLTGVHGQIEAVSRKIRTLFSAGKIPAPIQDELLSEYHSLGSPAVAVRSSATTEDLPEMSFAGQQETYLNVLGEEALLSAVVDCWSSLWTARAISYRLRNRVPQDNISLAVVVQCMVESEASGVLFTANPVSGLRSETVIDATLGLGEALVSGAVEPDHYVVDTQARQVIARSLGKKAISIHGRAGGGTSLVDGQDLSQKQALPDAQILALADLGKSIAAVFDFPQDIEWAWANDRLYILQSRPITSLFPLPGGGNTDKLKVFFSFGSVQGLLDPMTPFGQDIIREIFGFGSSLFGIRVTRQDQTVIYTAGERLWINITTPLKNTIGRKVILTALGWIEPTVKQALGSIMNDPHLQPGKRIISIKAASQIARFLLPLAANMILNLASPARRRKHIVTNGEQVLEDLKTHASAIGGDAYKRLAQVAALLTHITTRRFRKTLLLFVSGVASAMASFNFVNLLTRCLSKEKLAADQFAGLANWSDTILEITRGVPHNPTTEMDLELWRISQSIRSDPDSMQTFNTYSNAELKESFLSGFLPAVAQDGLSSFLQKYGQRASGEIDAGRQRWKENPEYLFNVITSYLDIKDRKKAPDTIFAQSSKRAERAINQLTSAVKSCRLGWIKTRLVAFFAGRTRMLLGMRENPKFFFVRVMGILRDGLLEVGQEFVRSGALDSPDDLFFLSLSELEDFASNRQNDWRSMILQRRQTYSREFQRRLIPRLLVSDGRTFYEGIMSDSQEENGITGSPVSPGSVEGKVRVVFDPRQANLLPGEILVCPGTDPSWTPLFMAAGGLIMETGGMMTHGAVVAREYGIPAVVGVDQATIRLKTGQRILLNGSSGQIKLLDQPT